MIVCAIVVKVYVFVVNISLRRNRERWNIDDVSKTLTIYIISAYDEESRPKKKQVI